MGLGIVMLWVVGEKGVFLFFLTMFLSFCHEGDISYHTT